MAKYILLADALKSIIVAPDQTADEKKLLIARLQAIPAADVRPVVLCKDCKYYTDGKLLGPTKFCYFYKIGAGLNTADDDFCSKGERRGENGN